MDNVLLRNALLILTFTIYFASCSSLANNKDLEDLEKYELTGAVQYVEEKFYYPKDPADLPDSSHFDLTENFRFTGKQQLHFSETGLLVEHKFFQPTFLSWQMFFDELGVIKEGTHYNAKQEVTKYVKVSYDPAGTPQRQTWYKEDSISFRERLFVYNERRQKVEEKYGSRKTTKFTYLYDEYGREIERKTYFNEVLSTKRVKTYNRKGKLSTRLAYSADGTLLWEENFEYRNNKLYRKEVSDHAKAVVRIYQYNPSGHLSEVSVREQGGDAKIKRYEKWTYQYDERGNWTRRVYYLDGAVQEVKTRDIEYR